jgi:regulatory protein YycH of two-component signal transduction system YycFG
MTDYVCLTHYYRIWQLWMRLSFAHISDTSGAFSKDVVVFMFLAEDEKEHNFHIFSNKLPAMQHRGLGAIKNSRLTQKTTTIETVVRMQQQQQQQQQQ